MKTSKILSQLRGKIIYIALIVFLLRMIDVHIIYFVPLLFVLYFVIKRIPWLLVYTGCILPTFLLSMMMMFCTPNTSRAIFVKGDITTGDITSFTGIQNGIVCKIYTDQDIDIVPGDQLLIQGEFIEQNAATIPHTFEYKNYLLSKRIKYTIFADTVEVVGHRFSLQHVRYKISDYIDRNAPLSGYYIKTFILADQSGFEEDIKADITLLGISHLFAVSGLHIGLLTTFLSFVLKRYLPQISPQRIIVPMLLLYIVITSFSPSVIRAGCLYFGISVNKKYRWNVSVLDLLSLIFIGYLIVSPYAIYSLGFSLSFLVTFTIILGRYFLENQSKTKQLMIISILALAVSLPLTVSINKEVNLLTILVNIILIYGMSFFILPMGYITFVLPFLDGIYYKMIQLYEKLITMFSSIDLLRFRFAFINHFHIMLYYVIVYLILISTGKRQKNMIIVGLFFMIVTFNLQILNPVQSVTMIDVYGDSIFIKDSFDRCNILVDTGVPDEYDAVIMYLKGEGIKRIDYLIVTHEDSDHKGERADIHQAFDIGMEINSSTTIKNDIICGGLSLEFFPFYDSYYSPNNQSVVFVLNIADTKYLFTGDMESKKELEFVRLYDIDVDVLKSPHHGSITSSTDRFLDDIQAEDVWVSCYRRNTHNHPHEEIIARYNQRNMNVYRTDYLGTIEQRYIFGIGYKKYHKP